MLVSHVLLVVLCGGSGRVMLTSEVLVRVPVCQPGCELWRVNFGGGAPRAPGDVLGWPSGLGAVSERCLSSLLLERLLGIKGH